MKRYATISILKEIKEILEREKGDRSWSEYLLQLYRDARTLRSRVAFEELRRILSEEDLEGIARSSEGFRRSFKLR